MPIKPLSKIVYFNFAEGLSMKKHLALFTVLISLLVSTAVGAQTIVLDGVPIGLTNPKEGHFTNLEATTQITLGAETITNFSGLDDDKVKVSSGDASDFLESQIVGGAGVTVNSDGSQITISAPPVNVEDSSDGVEVTYAGEGDYDTGTAVVPALDINGTGLVGTNLTVEVGGITSTVLASSSSPQQVIVRVPQGLNAGNYKLKVKNDNGFSEGLIPLKETFFDGSTWTEATSTAPWSGRLRAASVVYDNKMWVLGGNDGVNGLNDVWSSSDGVNWTQVTASAAWSARYAHSSLVYDNKVWVIGGYAGSRKNDVWYSSDGITWTQATASAGWSGRHYHSSVVHNNKMWVMGGSSGAGSLNDVWSSTDGITWTQATSGATWSIRYTHTSLVYDNKMWVFGGTDGTNYKNDVWSSTDGITWTQATASASWLPRVNLAGAVYNNKIWVIGGFDVSSGLNDVWSSSDGITWAQATASAAWSGRNSHTSVVFDNKMWVISGHDGTNYKNDVWHTSN
jgi:hypothetical protein